MNKIKKHLQIVLMFALLASIAFGYGTDYAGASTPANNTTNVANVTTNSTNTSITSGMFFGKTSNICEFWKAIFDFAIKIAAAIALLVVVIGGVFYIMSLGRSDRQQAAKSIMSGALVGMVLALTSWLLFYTLNPYILKCEIKVPTIQIAADPPYTGNKCGAWPPNGYATKDECEKDSSCTAAEHPCTVKVDVKAQAEIGAVVDSSTGEERWCCLNPKPGCPIDSPSVVACYGWRQWGAKKMNWHQGIDVYASYGTPVIAITDGFADCRTSSKCGYHYIKFKDNKGDLWAYVHLGGCKTGTYKQGDIIGFVDGRSTKQGGTDKCSNCPHLHFQKWFGLETDPLGSASEPLFADCFSQYNVAHSNCCAGQNCFDTGCGTSTKNCWLTSSDPPANPSKPGNRMADLPK